MEIVTGTLYRSIEDQGNKDWKLSLFGKQDPMDYDLEFEKINDKSGRTNLLLQSPKVLQGGSNGFKIWCTWVVVVLALSRAHLVMRDSCLWRLVLEFVWAAWHDRKLWVGLHKTKVKVIEKFCCLMFSAFWKEVLMRWWNPILDQDFCLPKKGWKSIFFSKLLLKLLNSFFSTPIWTVFFSTWLICTPFTYHQTFTIHGALHLGPSLQNLLIFILSSICIYSETFQLEVLNNSTELNFQNSKILDDFQACLWESYFIFWIGIVLIKCQLRVNCCHEEQSHYVMSCFLM